MGRFDLVLEVFSNAHGRRTTTQALSILFLRDAKGLLCDEQKEYIQLLRVLYETEKQLFQFISKSEYVDLASESSERSPFASSQLSVEDGYMDLRNSHKKLLMQIRDKKEQLISDDQLPDMEIWSNFLSTRLAPVPKEAMAIWITPREFEIDRDPFLLLSTSVGIEAFFWGARGLDVDSLHRLEKEITARMGIGRCNRQHEVVSQTRTTGISQPEQTRECLNDDANPFTETSLIALDSELRAQLERQVWEPLQARCKFLSIGKLHLVNSGTFYTLPWQGSSPKNINVSLHPGLFAYIKQSKAAPTIAPLPDSTLPLLVLAHDSHEDLLRRLYCISLEIEALRVIWGNDAVCVVEDLPHLPGAYAALLCLGHGGFDVKSGTAFLDLGTNRAGERRIFDQNAMATDCNDYFRFEASACVLARMQDIGNEPCGLISSALNKPSVNSTIAALLPIDDLLASLRTLLSHVSWKSGLTPQRAASMALAALETGNWPNEAIVVLRAVLLRTLPKLALAIDHDQIVLKNKAGHLTELRHDLTLKRTGEGTKAGWLWARLVQHMVGPDNDEEADVLSELADLIARNLPRQVASRPDIKTFTRYWMIC